MIYHACIICIVYLYMLVLPTYLIPMDVDIFPKKRLFSKSPLASILLSFLPAASICAHSILDSCQAQDSFMKIKIHGILASST